MSNKSGQQKKTWDKGLLRAKAKKNPCITKHKLNSDWMSIPLRRKKAGPNKIWISL